MEAGYLDTNAIVYFLSGTPLHLAEEAHALLRRAAAGAVSLEVPALVVAESVWVLESGAFGHSPAAVSRHLSAFLALPGVRCAERDIVLDALATHAQRAIDFVDAYLGSLAALRGPAVVFTKNRKDFRDRGLRIPDWA